MSIPQPWFFQIGVRGPLTIDAWADGATYAAAFLAGFHALLIGTEVAPAGTISLAATASPV